MVRVCMFVEDWRCFGWGSSPWEPCQVYCRKSESLSIVKSQSWPEYFQSEELAEVRPSFGWGPFRGPLGAAHCSALCASGIAEEGEYGRELTKFYGWGCICITVCASIMSITTGLNLDLFDHKPPLDIAMKKCYNHHTNNILCFIYSGLQHSIVDCVQENSYQAVEDSLCDTTFRPNPRPRTCNQEPCPPV